MEDVYTIKVKTKPDTRNLYPSERRYSASTVSGLAWVHIALAATSFLLACLALVNPNTQLETINNVNQSENFNQNGSLNGFSNVNSSEFENYTSQIESSNSNVSINSNGTLDNGNKSDNIYILVLAPSLITIFGLAAGFASILASIKWYIDHNITLLFVISCLTTIVSLTSFILIAVWFITTSEGDITEFYKDQEPFRDYMVVKHSDVIHRNDSHIIIALNPVADKEETPNMFTKRVLSINILIAAFLELLWSLLSVKISYKGMRNTYKEETQTRGNCISVVTKIKGNDTRKFPRNGKLLPPKSDLIEHYPSRKIKRIFLAQTDNGFGDKNQQNKTKPNTETSSEFYRERMMSFLNRCASLEGISNPEISPSVQSETLNPIPEIIISDSVQEPNSNEIKDRSTPISWGDTPDHTIYNQNTLNFDKIFKFKQNAKKSENEK